jgi:hypothetical protein
VGAILQLIMTVLKEKEANSRLAFLLQSGATAAAIIMVAVSFIRGTSFTGEDYALVLGTLLAGGTGLHFGRKATKQVGMQQQQQQKKEEEGE